MDVEVGRHGLVDLGEERLELLGPMPPPGGGDHLTGGDVEGGEEIGDPVAHVVVGATLHLAGSHGKDGLSPIEGLDAGLLVDAADDGVLGRVHVDADNVTDFLDEQRDLRRV